MSAAKAKVPGAGNFQTDDELLRVCKMYFAKRVALDYDVAGVPQEDQDLEPLWWLNQLATKAAWTRARTPEGLLEKCRLCLEHDQASPLGKSIALDCLVMARAGR